MKNTDKQRRIVAYLDGLQAKVSVLPAPTPALSLAPTGQVWAGFRICVEGKFSWLNLKEEA